MTQRIYEADSYCREFTATVLACEKQEEGYAVELDCTAFFPESGGQAADTGTLNAARVTDVQIQNGRILHMVNDALPVGELVLGRLDWEQRFLRMQKHSAEHILAGLIHRLYGFDNVGFHLGSEDVTLDINGELSREQLDDVETQANRLITENRKITATIPSEGELEGLVYRSKKEVDGPLRLVTIDGVDSCACCAPHVRVTGEIGVVKILEAIRYKGGMRLHMQAGMDALLDYRMRYRETAAAAALLSVKQDTLTDGVRRLQQERDELKSALRECRRSLARQRAQGVESTAQAVCLFGEDWDADTLREAVNTLSARCTGICAAMTAAGDGYRYVLGGHGDVKAFCERMHRALGGRGGGSSIMQQGQISASRQEISDFFQNAHEI